MQFSGKEEFIKDKVGLLEVEDDVQFADVAVVFVHLLDIAMDYLKREQLVVGSIAAGDEEERGIPTVYNFGVWRLPVSSTLGQIAPRSPTFVLKEVAHAGTAGEHELRHIFHDLGLVLGCQCGEPLGEALQLFSTGSCMALAGDVRLCPAARAG